MLYRSYKWRISVVVTEIDVGLCWMLGFELPVVDTECGEGNILACNRSGFDRCILRLKTGGKF